MTGPALVQDDPLEQLKRLREDPLEALKASRRSTAQPSVVRDATQVGPGPANPNASQVNSLAGRAALSVFEHGVPFTPIPGASAFEHPTELMGDMAMQAGGALAGPYIGRGASKVLSLVKDRLPGASAALDAVRSLPIIGNNASRIRTAGRVLDRLKGDNLPGEKELGGLVDEAAMPQPKPETASPTPQRPVAPFLGRTAGPMADAGDLTRSADPFNLVKSQSRNVGEDRQGVLDLIKQRQGMFDAFSDEARAADALPPDTPPDAKVGKPWKPRGKTVAQLNAERIQREGEPDLIEALRAFAAKKKP